VFGLSSSEWIMVGVIFLIVFAAPKVGPLGEFLASRRASKQLVREGPVMPEQPTLFVTDPTAEVAQISLALQARGYSVVDVPLSMLLLRVAAQVPSLIFVDADAPGALDVVRQLRGGPGGAGIEVLFFGERGKTLENTTDAVLAGASGFLARPLDPALVLRKVTALVPLEPQSSEGVVSSQRPSWRAAGPPSLIPPSRRSVPPLEAGWGAEPAGPAVPRLSEELEQVLRSAETRVGQIQDLSSEPPLPEDEVNAVLPPALLAFLDEPLLQGDGSGSWGSATPDPRRAASLSALAPALLGTDASVRAPSVMPPSREGGFPDTSTRVERVVRPGSEPPPLPPADIAASLAPPIPSLPPEVLPSSAPPSPPSPPSPLPLPVTVAPRQALRSQEAPRVVPPPPPSSPVIAPVVEPALMPRLDPGLRPGDPRESRELPDPVVLLEGAAMRLLARAVGERFSGVLCFDAQGGLRRVVFRDGDLVTVSSTVEQESLVSFLVLRGDLTAELGKKLEGRLPPFGRHAGAALVAHGHLSQDRLWETLRGHAEWLVCKILGVQEGVCQYEAEPAGRLRAEPAVFGGSTGSEVLVELGRRTIPAEEARRLLGGSRARLAEGPRFSLLGECALEPGELGVIERCRGFTLGEVIESETTAGLPSVLLVLVALGVLEALAPVGAGSLPPPARDELDDEALRARVRARMALVEEGDYFALLGVPRAATPYEIRRAYLELRRSFEPSRVLTPATAELVEPVQVILEVLDEAFEVLRDTTRRERYRRAIEARPPEEGLCQKIPPFPLVSSPLRWPPWTRCSPPRSRSPMGSVCGMAACSSSCGARSGCSRGRWRWRRGWWCGRKIWRT
jgi:CheY-like chemotaxis protein